MSVLKIKLKSMDEEVTPVEEVSPEAEPLEVGAPAEEVVADEVVG